VWSTPYQIKKKDDSEEVIDTGYRLAFLFSNKQVEILDK
jgi:hypothetical protein